MIQKLSPAAFHRSQKLIHSIIGIIHCSRNFYIAGSTTKLTLIRATSIGNINLSRIVQNLHRNCGRNSIIVSFAHVGEKILCGDNIIAHSGACQNF